MVYLCLLVVLLAFLIWFIHFHKIYIKTSTMAAVMSLGIIAQGVLFNYFGNQFSQGFLGKFLSIINLSLWLAFVISFFMAFFGGKFKEIHYSNQINRFAMGTWIAGTSICGILLHVEFNQLVFIPRFITVINVVLWVIYIGISSKTLIEIIRTKRFKNVHGILLLTTVSTQSIVLLINTVFKGLPSIMNMTFLIIGFCFYMICAFFILFRYLMSSWSIEKDWNNTNCILHGALSISGIACIKTGLVNADMITFIWVSAMMIFLLIESVEIFRMIKRIKHYGIQKGIWIYDVTQWGRIFTFAMFYTFTSTIKQNFELLVFIKEEIIHTGIWIVLSLLIIEIVLCSNFIIKTYLTSQKEMHKENEVTFP